MYSQNATKKNANNGHKELNKGWKTTTSYCSHNHSSLALTTCTCKALRMQRQLAPIPSTRCKMRAASHTLLASRPSSSRDIARFWRRLSYSACFQAFFCLLAA